MTMLSLMSGKKGTEKLALTRRVQRLRIDVPARLIVHGVEHTKIIEGRFRDVSDDGVGIFAGVELKMDTEVSVEFTPAFDSPPLRINAVVRSRRGYVYGLEFLPLDGKEDRTLATLKALLLPTGTKLNGSPEDRRS